MKEGEEDKPFILSKIRRRGEKRGGEERRGADSRGAERGEEEKNREESREEWRRGRGKERSREVSTYPFSW